MMDDFSIGGAVLEQTLDELGLVNRWLGGHGATWAVLGPVVRAAGRPLAVLDVGTGGGDGALDLVRRSARGAHGLRAVGLDANPVTLASAQRRADAGLTAAQRACVSFVEGDARAMPFEDDTFDVAVASLVLHHFDEDEAVRVLREMERVSRGGIVVNDLHRHALAYAGIRVLAALLPTSVMFAHDAPLSVRRGYVREELYDLAFAAGLSHPSVRWHWAFRWTLDTVRT